MPEPEEDCEDAAVGRGSFLDGLFPISGDNKVEAAKGGVCERACSRYERLRRCIQIREVKDGKQMEVS